MNYRDAEAKEKEEMFELKRKHRSLSSWCDEIDGTLEITEEVLDGNVTRGLTCRTHTNQLVSEYKDDRDNRVVEHYGGQTEIQVEGSVRRHPSVSRLLLIEDEGEQVGHIEEY